MVATDDLWAVRVVFAGNIFRLLGWMEGTDKLVLAHGFTKKTEKTSLQEIQITETRKTFMKTKKPDDLDRYIAQRKEKDAEFTAAYDSEQAEWELGQLLAKTRESAGLTQDALARKIGSTRSAICRYERHPANLTLSTLEKVARATGRRLIVKFA